MILRRFSQALKEQNWPAIWIEFVLLVAGVFLGIQVSNWNQQRTIDVVANARATMDALEGRAALSNEALLIAAYRATQYSEYVQYRATYDELTSTGNMGRIADLQLRKMATEIYATQLYDNVKNEGINSAYRVAFRMRIPSDVQRALVSSCGDRNAHINNYESIKKPLDYPCTTGLPRQTIDSAAAILRADASLVPLLRLRLANIYSATSTQMLSDEVLENLRALSKGKP